MRELDFGMAITYFETVKDTHYHLVCRVCKTIVDLDHNQVESVRISRLPKGFLVERQSVDILGTCAGNKI